MMRDMDLIREILLALEANPDLNGQSLHRGCANEFFEKEGVSGDDVAYHLLLLIDRNFVIGSYDRTSGMFDIECPGSAHMRRRGIPVSADLKILVWGFAVESAMRPEVVVEMLEG
ncbi:MAG: DUF2513 domain-containing protein, partial [Methylocella sp.]